MRTRANRVIRVIAVAWLSAMPMATRVQAMEIPSAVEASISQRAYTVPPVTLLDQHGRVVRLDQALSGNKPVLVQFFFTTCTTICGVRSAQLCSIAPKLAKAGVSIDFYSISIDPDRDTPEHLLDYSHEFGPPPPNWHLLTGAEPDTRKVQAAFDASDPSADRMMHRPLTFIRAGNGHPWLRIDGMMSARELMRQIETAVAAAR